MWSKTSLIAPILLQTSPSHNLSIADYLAVFQKKPQILGCRGNYQDYSTVPLIIIKNLVTVGDISLLGKKKRGLQKDVYYVVNF